MEFKASAKNIRVSPQKLGLLADVVRGKKVQFAVDSLNNCEKRWARDLSRLISSALNNASQNRGVNVDALYVKTVTVGQGFTLKRFMTRARGSSAKILKRCSNITVALAEKN